MLFFCTVNRFPAVEAGILIGEEGNRIMTVQFKTFSSVEGISRLEWDGLAAPAGPMMEWGYFYSLEKSESASPDRGYKPCHLAAYDSGRPIALAPLYERDRAWVEFGDGGLLEFLSEVTGHPYRRGLVGTLPFTPVPGYRFLNRPEVDPCESGRMLLEYIDFLCETQGLSTSRFYFLAPEAPFMNKLLQAQGYMGLRSQYCIWRNEGYRTFDDFLLKLKTGRRTKIRRELRTIRESGVEISMVPAAVAPSSFYDEMFELYMNTWTKHMGLEIPPFLNRKFFKLLEETYKPRTVFSVARQNGRIIAMAIFYLKGGSLYGRYWGCHEETPFLHFAVCYYYPIDYAIRIGIEMMDPGFGGEHKLHRGYEIAPAYHYIKFHGERERRLAAAMLERVWPYLGLVRNKPT